MTCEEFERVLPELGSGHSMEQEEHLKSCSACSDLVADLNAISQQARLLKGSEEPSPWVWSSIEVALRQEGLIRQPQPEVFRPRAPVPLLGWKLRWLVPLAAAFLVAFGVLMHQHRTASVAERPNPLVGVVTADAMAGEDVQLLNTVAERMPSMRASYESNLRLVNAYIRDAEQSAHNDPNDEVAQQYLRNAYEQKAMVYQMALDRSLP
jgi:ABC-type iron transport system FetAB permease component